MPEPADDVGKNDHDRADRSATGPVRLRLERSGRRGKAVTTIHGLSLDTAGLKDLAGALKRRCGCGGAVKGGVIEIQGDQRDIVKTALEERGYTVKLAGG